MHCSISLTLCRTTLRAGQVSGHGEGTTVNNGVVIVNINDAGKAFELQCNQAAPHCTAAQPGSYWMVRLPKNHGLYDCANVDLYAQSANTEDPDNVLGEYCINEK